ncbi:hypothetical protein D3C85_1397860 [compost metagenome]
MYGSKIICDNGQAEIKIGIIRRFNGSVYCQFVIIFIMKSKTIKRNYIILKRDFLLFCFKKRIKFCYPKTRIIKIQFPIHFGSAGVSCNSEISR